MLFPRPPKPLHTRQQHNPEVRLMRITDPIRKKSGLRYLPGGFTLNEIKTIIENHNSYPTSLVVSNPYFIIRDDHVNRPSIHSNSHRRSVREHNRIHHIREMIGNKENCDGV